MFSHVMFGSNDLEKSKVLYDALFTAIGGKPARVDEKGRLFYFHKGSMFIVTTPIDGQPATYANGGTIGFAAESPDEVEAWHAAGVAAGGTPIEDPPGWREAPGVRLYLAYLRDPDGNKICAMHRGA